MFENQINNERGTSGISLHDFNNIEGRRLRRFLNVKGEDEDESGRPRKFSGGGLIVWKLFVVDLSSGALAKTFDTPDVPVLPTPGEFALTPDGIHAYLSCPQGGTIEVLNLNHWKLEEPIRLTKGVDGMAWVPSTTN